MTGDLLDLEEARRRILRAVRPLPIERLPLEECRGRRLGEELRAPLDLPPFPCSAMDGWAVRSADTRGARPARPVYLRGIGTAAAGAGGAARLSRGTALRIFTGAPLPPGADAVVRQEDVAGTPPGGILLVRPLDRGADARPAGEDVRRGQVAAPAGTLLTPPILGLLAGLGFTRLPVRRAPRVALFTTGDEVVPPGGRLRAGQIYDSNGPMLSALLAQAGVRVIRRGHLSDRLETVVRTLRRAAAGADLVVTSGGISVGDYDFVRAAVLRVGRISFWRVRVKPGKPFLFGRVGGALFFALPGSPYASWFAFESYLRPALRKMGGAPHPAPRRISVRTATPFPASRDRVQAVRSRVEERRGLWEARPVGTTGSGSLSPFLEANAIVLVPRGARPVPRGSLLPADLLDLEGLAPPAG